MYLSKVMLRMSQSNLQSAIWDGQRMHRLVTGLYGTDRKDSHILYRLRLGNPESVLYLYSDTPVAEDRLLPGMTLAGSCNLKPWLEQLSQNRVYGFDLVAMPAKKRPVQGGGNSRRVLLPTQEERLNWLERKAEQGGFSIQSVQEMNASDAVVTHAPGDKFRFTAYHYQGFLTITDKQRFLETLRCGIGPERAYGLGMLLLR